MVIRGKHMAYAAVTGLVFFYIVLPVVEFLIRH